MKNINRLIALLIAFSFGSVFAQTNVLAGFSNSDYDAAAAGGPDATASVSSAGMTVGDLKELGAASFSTAGPGVINWQSSVTGSNLASAVASGNFVQFTIKADAAHMIDLASLTFKFGGSQSTGTTVDMPISTYVRISINGTNFVTVGMPYDALIPAADTLGAVTVAMTSSATNVVDMSAYSGLTEEVTIQIGSYMRNYNNASRYIRGGDISLAGTVRPRRVLKLVTITSK